MSRFGGPRSPSSRGDRFPGAGNAVAGGLTIVLAVLLFFSAGAWLDSRFGTSPGLSLLGAFIGGAAGIYRLCRRAVAPRRRDTEQR